MPLTTVDILNDKIDEIAETMHQEYLKQIDEIDYIVIGKTIQKKIVTILENNNVFKT